MILQVQNISKKYGKQQAVDAISFSVEKGEIVGFLGPNGAGKSTTMRMLTGCISADKGDVLISGFSISKQALKAKSNLGYLPEHNPLYEEMYVKEYLEYVAGMYDLPAKDIKIQVDAIVNEVGLQPESHKKIAHLSKGYRQRVGLAQAFVHDPQLLVLDEPITGLDPNQIEEIESFLRNKSREKAILFSSHTLSEVASVCTRIIIIHKGKIVLDEPINNIENLDSTFKELTKR